MIQRVRELRLMCSADGAFQARFSQELRRP